ncbi:putative iron-sulphur cluster biosynthesis [Lyophyllum shimeji]|uniref:Iron-sulphur cluster biosynthesis n=1 Tax=Lyophyllum shimeji TaxID=47721 RepID=A0A9P3PJG3_LYOSH|nr:putative iron-sulphur cluster biosynthesis [Lyophyllum shimeji]
MSTATRLASRLIRQQASSWTRIPRTPPPAGCSTRLATRHFSRTSFRNATLASHPQGKPTVVLSTPSPEFIEQEELDVDLPRPEEVKLVITDRAAEQLRAIAQREHNPHAALRISVESGGCHGYQYKMQLATSQEPDDYHFSHPTLQPSNILVDAISFSLLNGSTIDFATELIGSSFRVVDNPRAKGSGCGCGVSWELKD